VTQNLDVVAYQSALWNASLEASQPPAIPCVTERVTSGRNALKLVAVAARNPLPYELIAAAVSRSWSGGVTKFARTRRPGLTTP